MTITARLRRRGSREGLLARSRETPQAFAEFYRAMAPGMLRYFMRHVADPQRALDLTAESFAKAFEKRGDFRGSDDEQAAAWLWSIARTELARSWRSRNVELAAIRRLGMERPSASHDELLRLEELSALEEARGHVGAALESLPRDQREVIQLRFERAMSYEEIAERLGVSAEVVRARTSRGLRSLREHERVADAANVLET